MGEDGEAVASETGGGVIQEELGKEESSAREKAKVQRYTWTPVGHKKALLFLCHGYGERLVPDYSQLAEAGRASGLLVFGHDHVGHGRSEGERGQFSDFQDYTEPLLVHCKEMKEKFPDLPLFVAGFSLGALIALISVLETQDLFAGLILVGPLIHLKSRSLEAYFRERIPTEEAAAGENPNEVGDSSEVGDRKETGCFKNFLAAMMSKVRPSSPRAGTDIKLVTWDPDWQKMEHLTLQVLDSLPDQFCQLTLPYLILHGAADQICSPSASETLHRETRSTDKTLKMIEGAEHNLFAEKEKIRSEAIRETVDWILARFEKMRTERLEMRWAAIGAMDLSSTLANVKALGDRIDEKLDSGKI